MSGRLLNGYEDTEDTMADFEPYLSLVVTSRNDGHGGDLLGRMNIFIGNFVEQCRQYGLSAEIILVEWNPPDDRPKLVEALDLPQVWGPVSTRIIEVSPWLHARFRHSEALPLFQMIAKNVGIRRARGKFVLATNVDIILSDPLMRYLAKKQLRRDRMYRTDRQDVDEGVPVGGSVGERLKYCADRNHVLRICERGGTRICRNGTYDVIFPPHGLLLARAVVASLLGGFGERKLGCSARNAWDFYRFHRSIGRLHTNACGDFTLLSRQAWHELRGYAEWEMYSFHLDSLLCHAAHASGFREQRIAGCPIYHIEQTSGAAFQPEQQTRLWTRLREAGIERLSDEQLWREVVALRTGRRSPIFNDEGWGLAEHQLPEILVGNPSNGSGKQRPMEKRGLAVT
jgi:hypothetical protein